MCPMRCRWSRIWWWNITLAEPTQIRNRYNSLDLASTKIRHNAESYPPIGVVPSYFWRGIATVLSIKWDKTEKTGGRASNGGPRLGRPQKERDESYKRVGGGVDEISSYGRASGVSSPFSTRRNPAV